MKKIILLLCFSGVLADDSAQAQGLAAMKPAIDPSLYGNWPSIEGRVLISNDGKYVLYGLTHQPRGATVSSIGKGNDKKSLVITSVRKSSWEVRIPSASVFGAAFSENSRYAFFKTQGDSLGIVRLGTSAIEYIPKVTDHRLIQQRKTEYLLYQLQEPASSLFIRNLTNGREIKLEGVVHYVIGSGASFLVVLKESGLEGTSRQSICWVNMSDGDSRTVWQGTGASGLVCDKKGTQLAFTVRNPALRGAALWLYRKDQDAARLLLDHHVLGMGEEMELDEISGFIKEGDQLFFQIKEKVRKVNSGMDAVAVNVWSYTDRKLQPQQLKEGHQRRSFAAVWNKSSGAVIRLEQEREWIEYNGGSHGKVVLVGRGGDCGDGEREWNKACDKTSLLVSTVDGSRQMLPFSGILSPEEKYIIYYDPERKNYFSYEVRTGQLRNISKGVPFMGMTYGDPRPEGGLDQYSFFSLVGWLEGDEAVLLYDQYDIWKMDPAGVRPPVSVTNGYGRRHQIQFRFVSDSREPRKASEPCLIAALNLRTKDNGFYRKRLDLPGDPQLLTMGPYMYFAPDIRFDLHGAPPVKARDAEAYVVRRMGATESPNYFYTTDFKTFRQLTFLEPEREYNWYTTELHEWYTPDGTFTQGILYKPENFNPNEKYPLIFYYYENLSEGLHAYLPPEASDGRLNVSWYASNGYLVFCPDIHYRFGYAGEGALYAVESAVRHLSRYSWVDTKRMGIQGLSYGGFQTNYIVTHSNLFAAACSGSGPTDLVSYAGGLDGGGGTRHGFTERGQLRMNATIWERPDQYVKNSAVMSADKVTSPLLIFHTTIDDGVPFPQSIEFFTALRRLGKKVWMLEYNEGNHGVWGKDALDFDIRMQQFFDHYLKGKPAPKWMTRGVPARLKGINMGLELDYEVKTPDFQSPSGNQTSFKQ